MSDWTDDDFRSAAFDFLKGDLSADEMALMRGRIAESEAFADYVKRLGAMLESPKKAPPESAHLFDKDDLFAKIAAQVAPGAAQDISDIHPPVVLHFPREEEALLERLESFEEEVQKRSAPWLWAAAALLIAGFAVYAFRAQEPESAENTEMSVAQVEQQQAKDVVKTPVQELATAKPDMSPEMSPKLVPSIALAELTSVPTKREAVRVFASTGAEWKIEGEKTQKVALDKGTLLVEFTPTKDETLSFTTRQFEVRVIGTIFYASDEAGVVGVLAGKVQVLPKEGEVVTLTSGQEYVVGEGVHTIEKARLEDAKKRVNVE